MRDRRGFYVAVGTSVLLPCALAVSVWAQGGGGWALHFDGQDDYVLAPTLDVSAASQLTIEAWVKPDELTNNIIRQILGQERFSPTMPNTPTWRMRFIGRGQYLTFGVCGSTLGSTEIRVPIVAGNYADGNWHHLAGSYDGYTGRLYHNGQQIGEFHSGCWLQPEATVNTIGACAERDPPTYGFNGAIDEVRIWNVARSAAEILATMNRGLIGNETGLIEYYRFDEGTGTVVTDATGQGRNGEVRGAVWVTSGVPMGQPFVATGAASGITTNTTILNGVVTPYGRTTSAWFEWGATPSYGNATAIQYVGSGTDPVPISQFIAGLAPGTTYHFRLVARDTVDRTPGLDRQFTTVDRPAVTTLTAAVDDDRVVLKGTVNPFGHPTSGWFEWGADTNYVNLTPRSDLGDGYSSLVITQILTALPPGVSYHFRCVASNAVGQAAGADQQFVAQIPEATTQSPFNLTGFSGVLRGTADPNGLEATAWIEYGPATGFDQTTTPTNIGNGFTPIPVVSSIAGLSPNTTYRCRLVVTNRAGTRHGTEVSFTTPGPNDMALRLDGVDDFVSLPVVNLGGKSNLTLEAWIKPLAFSAGTAAQILQLHNSLLGQPVWMVTFQNGGSRLAFGLQTTLTNYVLDLTLGTNNPLDGRWHHVAGTFDGLASRLYWDGALLGTTNATGNLITGGSQHALGAILNRDFFNGMMDEVRIWSVTRSAEEIALARFQPLVGIEPGLEAYWRFSEGSGVLAGDASGHDRNGTLTDGPTWLPSDAPLRYPLAATLPAAEIGIAAATLNGRATANGRRTTAWFEWGTNLAYGHTTLQQDVGSGLDYVPITDTLQNLTPGTIYHYRCVASNELAQTQGADASFLTLGPPVVTTMPALNFASNMVTLAASVIPNGFGTTVWFEYGETTGYGSLTDATNVGASTGEFMVSGVAVGLTPLATYHYRAVAANSQGTSYGADRLFTAMGAAGSALQFDGTDDRLLTPNLSPFFTNESMTIELWFNASGPGVICDELGTNSASAAWHNSVMEVLSNGQLRARVWPLSSIHVGTVAFGSWNHFTLRYDKAALLLDGFLNGERAAMTAGGDRRLPWEHNAEYQLHYALGLADTTHLGSGAFFRGQMDEVRIWNRARSDAEIQGNLGRRLTGQEAGLAAYYRLDDGAGNRALDATTNGLTASLEGGLVWTSSEVPLGRPTLATLPPLLTSPSSVRFRSRVNPEGLPTTAWFEWNTSGATGNVTAAQSAGSGPDSVAVTQTLTDAPTDITAYVRALAANANGTSTGAVFSFVAGTNNKALRFDGANDFVNAPALNLSGSNGLTLEAWVRTSPLGWEQACQLIHQKSPTNAAPDWLLALLSGGRTLSFGTRTVTGYQRFDVSVPRGEFTDQRWHHIAATYDGTQQALYHNGMLLGLAPLTGVLSNSAAATTIAAATGGGEFLPAAVDEVRIWNLARSAAEIRASLNHALTGSEPGLAACWRLDEGAGLQASDSSGNGPTGELVNGPVWVPSDALEHPLAISMPAAPLTNFTATLNGLIDPEGQSAVAWFEWGLTTNYGNRSDLLPVASATDLVPISWALTNLDAGTLYHFRCVASNATERFAGLDWQFTTTGPQVITQPASALSATSMALNGRLNFDGRQTYVWFDWGLTTNYGQTAALGLYGCSYPCGSDASTVLSNLAPGLEYHFRLMATNEGGLGVGRDERFTLAFAPTEIALPRLTLYDGGVAWGDYDRDSDLDILAVGNHGTNSFGLLLRNDSSQFTFVGSNPYLSSLATGVKNGTGLWGDFDNDGDLDIVLAGWNDNLYGPLARIYHNENGTFTNLMANLGSVAYASAACADYDNDGWLDVLIVGRSWGPWSFADATNLLYQNTGNGSFALVPTGMPGVSDGAVAWGDFDNDGDPDIALAGLAGSNVIARIYRNDDDGVFTDIAAGLAGVCGGSAAWGDYDDDGDLDLVLTGATNCLYCSYGMAPSPLTRIYRNDHGVFRDAGGNLPGVVYGAAGWGDLDNDGDLDIVLTGQTADGTVISRVYLNEAGAFTDIGAGLPGAQHSAVACGDYDGDGRLDLLMIGYGNAYWSEGIRVFKNVFPVGTGPLPAPTSPTGLEAEPSRSGVTLRWGAATAPTTPTAGLTYNLRVGTLPGGTQITASHSDLLSGQRRVPQRGNADQRLFATLTNLPVGNYFWTVQAVDNTFAGSAWAPEQSFAVTTGPPVITLLPASNILCCSAQFASLVTPGGLTTHAWFEWGTTTNFGNATAAIDLGTGMVPQWFVESATGLQPRTTYFLRAAASNLAGLALSSNATFSTAMPAPTITTLQASHVSSTSVLLLASGPLNGPLADIFFEWGLTTNYGWIATAAVVNAALRFDGVDDFMAIGWGRFPTATNSFTLELWAKPDAARAVTAEAASGTAGVGGQRYAVLPDNGTIAYGAGHAGAGLSVGTNGVSVMEHANMYMPPVAVHTGSLPGWTHVALVYSNHLPLLYLNGALARTGLITTAIVHPSAGLGGTTNLGYGQFEGALEDVRVWSTPLPESVLREWMSQPLTPQHPAYPHLLGYWPLMEGQGTTTADLSGRGNAGILRNGVSWTGGHTASEAVFAAEAIGLLAGTQYHFRAVAMNPGGTALGEDQTFTTPARATVTCLAPQPDRSWLLSFNGVPGSSYTLETSTNLIHWIALTNLLAGPNGLFDHLDPTATNWPARFYRLKAP